MPSDDNDDGMMMMIRTRAMHRWRCSASNGNDDTDVDDALLAVLDVESLLPSFARRTRRLCRGRSPPKNYKLGGRH